MSHGRHTATTPEQSPPTPSLRDRVLGRRSTRLALLAAPLATVAVVSGGIAVAGHLPGSAGDHAQASEASLSGATIDVPRDAEPLGAANRDRTLAVSRSVERDALPPVQAAPTGRRWTTATLDLRGAPTPDATTFGTVASAKHIGVTGDVQGGYTEVVVDGARRWVTTARLSEKKPVTDPAQLPLASGSCASTAGVESGLTSGAVKVYQAVCHAFPQITTYGGYDGHGEHASGKAIDIMTSDSALGDRIAAFLQGHAAELDLYDIIWQQHIWTPVRSSEGWRSMASRGDATANHMDHVHVSVN